MASSISHTMLITFDLLSVFLFSGIIFGWASFYSMLLSEGTFYSSMCRPGDPLPCKDQQLALNQAFTYASTAVSAVALPAGWFVDTHGPMVASVLAGILEVLGLLGIAMCEQFPWEPGRIDVFLWSLVTIAVGGALTMFCGYALPFLYPARATLLISATSCLFDGSTIIFPALRALYDGVGISFAALNWCYMGLAVAIYTMLVFSWWLCREDLKASRSTTLFDPDEDAQAESPPKKGLSAQPLSKQVCSFEFLCIMVFASINVARSNLYLGTIDIVNHAAARVSGAAHGQEAQALTIAGLVIPLGFVFIPMIDICVARAGLIGTLHVTSVLGFIYNGLQMYPTLTAQLVGTAAFAAFRAFLFSIISAFVMETFGPLSMGRIMGIAFLGAAVANFAQLPLVDMTLHEFGGDCTAMLLIVLLASAPLPLGWIALSLKQHWQEQRELASSREQPLLYDVSPRLRRSSSITGVAPFGGPAMRKSEERRSVSLHP